MQPAIAEKGLMVLDVTAYGKAGHAARNEGVNAIYKVLEDIQWFRDYKFPKESSLLGPVKMSVTQIKAARSIMSSPILVLSLWISAVMNVTLTKNYSKK